MIWSELQTSDNLFHWQVRMATEFFFNNIQNDLFYNIAFIAKLPRYVNCANLKKKKIY